MFLLKTLTRLLRFLFLDALRPVLFPRPKNRAKVFVAAIFLSIFFLGNFAEPSYWNRFADFLNPKLRAINTPGVILRLDKIGVFKTLDGIFVLPHFWQVPYHLGLDLRGGVRLVYEADAGALAQKENKDEAMAGLRDVIERRINLFGVSEPSVYIQESGESRRLVVELAGVSDVSGAIARIGETPDLQFKEEVSDRIFAGIISETPDLPPGTENERATLCRNGEFIFGFIAAYQKDPCFIGTGLSGAMLERASVDVNEVTGEPVILLKFNEEGTRLFGEITGRNVGKILAVYLDGVPRDLPTVQQEITGGSAQMSGSYTLAQAKETARYLNAGALPIPVQLIAQQKVGATLGDEAVSASLKAGVLGVLLVIAFLLLIYRFAGFVAVIALFFYLVALLTVIKLIPVTLTLPGIAGLILSLGMAVDANILIFERLREELRTKDAVFHLALDRAFARAWPSIRDGNITTLLTALILFFLSTSFVRGFALTLGIGVALSMFSAVIVTKYLMKWFAGKKLDKFHSIWTR